MEAFLFSSNQNIILVAFGFANALIMVLGFLVYVNRRNSITNQTFLFFAFLTVAYGVFNYLNAQVDSPYLILWFIRLTVFAAVWHAYAIFQLFYIYPNEQAVFPRWYRLGLLPTVTGTAFLTLTPYVYPAIIKAPLGIVSQPVQGPLVPLFGIVSGGLVVAAVLLLAKKTLLAEQAQRRQYSIMLFGTITTFALILFFNVVLPILFKNVQFISLVPFFFFPFAFAVAYTIIRHGLFNIKVVATEFLASSLIVISIVEIFFADSVVAAVERITVGILVLYIGLYLISSVKKEIKRREEVTILAESLETANIRLQELDKQKTDFLSIAAHQLRTPLSIANGYIELLQDDAYGHLPLESKKILGNMDESNQRLVKLVDEFLDITRIEQGRTSYAFKPGKIDAVIRSVVTELRDRAHEHKLQIETQIDNLPPIIFDEEKIRHVVFNFVDNAIKYAEKGKVTIFAEEAAGGVTVRVTDEGVGFNKVDAANFFQKFYRGDNVKGTNVNGTGLGLYVCRKFIEAHHGRVSAKSAGLGQGSEFSFWLPFSQTDLSTNPV